MADPPSAVPPPSEPPARPRMHVFVTVGSTRFDGLVHSVLEPDVRAVLRAKGYTSLDVQCGNSDFDASTYHLDGGADGLWKGAAGNDGDGGLQTSVWRFKPSLAEDYERADLVVSHAGSGTIIDVLRLGKPLIVIPNPTLLDNHQQELADALAQLGHLVCTTLADLPTVLKTFDASKLVPFPKFDGSRFREILDEEMGFVPPKRNSK